MPQNSGSSKIDEHSPEVWFVSVAFWLTLFAAAAVYAAVVLSPKMQQMLLLQREYVTGQWELVELEHSVHQMQRVAAALQQDPDFAAELARSRFGTPEGNGTALLVSDELSLEAGGPVLRQPAAALPWYYPLVATFAGHTRLRQAALATAAGLILAGFGFLHPRYAPRIRTYACGVSAIFRAALRRYLA